MRRIWQRSLIAAARSQLLKRFLHARGSILARRYVSGPSAQDAANAAEGLLGQGIRASAFYLGEYVDAPELVRENVAQKLNVAEALSRRGLDVHVSVDPTQIGYRLSPGLAALNAQIIAQRIAQVSADRPGVHCLMLDMEDYSVVDQTLAIYRALISAGLPAAITLQAYLRRTESDLSKLIKAGARVRIVKGAFALRQGPAFDTHRQIKDNFCRLVGMMLSREARDSGFYPSIATHDSRIHELALELAGKHRWDSDRFEFEMLFGIRPDLARQIAAGGTRIRLYLPFGKDWWPYAARRIGETPANGWLLVRSMFGGGEPRRRE